MRFRGRKQNGQHFGVLFSIEVLRVSVSVSVSVCATGFIDYLVWFGLVGHASLLMEVNVYVVRIWVSVRVGVCVCEMKLNIAIRLLTVLVAWILYEVLGAFIFYLIPCVGCYFDDYSCLRFFFIFCSSLVVHLNCGALDLC